MLVTLCQAAFTAAAGVTARVAKMSVMDGVIATVFVLGTVSLAGVVFPALPMIESPTIASIATSKDFGVDFSVVTNWVALSAAASAGMDPGQASSLKEDTVPDTPMQTASAERQRTDESSAGEEGEATCDTAESDPDPEGPPSGGGGLVVHQPFDHTSQEEGNSSNRGNINLDHWCRKLFEFLLQVSRGVLKLLAYLIKELCLFLAWVLWYYGFTAFFVVLGWFFFLYCRIVSFMTKYTRDSTTEYLLRRVSILELEVVKLRSEVARSQNPPESPYGHHEHVHYLVVPQRR